MKRRNKIEQAKHFGIANGWTRKEGTRICKRELPGQKPETKLFDSINKAKHFMRTGSLNK